MRHARVLLVPIVGVLTGALLAGVAAAQTAKTAGQVMAVAGPVTVARADVIPRQIKFRDSLYWRDVVEARKNGIARVLLGGKATVTVRELSRLELREEKRVEGVRYVADLVSGRIRASVARMLMRPGDQVEVWTFNTVASVRGTDFIVETVERPVQAPAFGLLGVREVAHGVGDSAAASGETVVVTLSGLVDVSNPLAETGRAARIGAYEAARISGRHDPVRFQVGANELNVLLKGLTPPRPQEARSADRAAAVAEKVEQAAQATSSQSAGAFGQSAGLGLSRGQGNGDPQGSQSGGLSSRGTGNGPALTQGNGLALGQLNGGTGIGLGLGKANLAKDVEKEKEKGKKK
ncbi:MAG: FecR domain-containing protein [Candidatus Rokubacteria bacterium]|nr:FecR domain-containing protein [Candidatus Rokubacteria bacterium]